LFCAIARTCLFSKWNCLRIGERCIYKTSEENLDIFIPITKQRNIYNFDMAVVVSNLENAVSMQLLYAAKLEIYLKELIY
jgi:hypothetical protein